MTPLDRAAAFRLLHTQPPLVLPNAWDAGSARAIERAGARAIATTSAGVSWARGRQDGQNLGWGEAVEALRSIVAAVELPVSADIESGYGPSPVDVAGAVAAVLDAGVVGINLEDAPGRHGALLLEADAQADRIRAAREVATRRGADLFINVRTDVYLAGARDPADRLDAVFERAAAYTAAGADGLFVPGVTDAETIAALASGIDVPLNVMAGPGALSVDELARLGVCRVSLGPAVALGALTLAYRAAREALTSGTYRHLEDTLPFGEVDAWFARV